MQGRKQYSQLLHANEIGIIYNRVDYSGSSTTFQKAGVFYLLWQHFMLTCLPLFKNASQNFIFVLLVLVTFSAQHLRPWNSFETRCAGLEWCDDSWQWNQDLPGNPTLNLDTKYRSYRTLNGISLLLPIENRKLKHVTFLSQGRQAEVSCIPLMFTLPHLYY